MVTPINKIKNFKGFFRNELEDVNINNPNDLNLPSSLLEFFTDIKGENHLAFDKFSFPIDLIFLDRLALYNDERLSKMLYDPDENNNFPKPKIFIGTLNILEQEKLSSQNELRSLNSLDNNIWTYYIMLEEKAKFIIELRKILDVIEMNFELGLYDSRICQEYIEIHSRIVKENVIKGLGGHGTQVKPFVFTSETSFKHKVRKCLEALISNLDDLKSKERKNISEISSLKPYLINWKILLVDDFSKVPLNKGNIEISDRKQNDKLSILHKVFQKLNGLVQGVKVQTNEHNNNIEKIDQWVFQIQIDHADTIDEAKSKLKEDTYDIILLDYLFSSERRYGIEVLKELEENNNVKIGPFGEYWIIPVSVFSNAFIDDMRNQGISFTNEKWNLSRGGDFVNTPWLFLYYFTLFQATQINRGAKLFTDEINNDIDKFVEKFKNKEKDILEGYKNEALENYQRLILDFKDFASLDSSNSLFINSLTEVLHTNVSFRKIKHYHTFLYNLSFRNFENNEDIAIEYHILNALNVNKE